LSNNKFVFFRFLKSVRFHSSQKLDELLYIIVHSNATLFVAICKKKNNNINKKGISQIVFFCNNEMIKKKKQLVFVNITKRFIHVCFALL
jgi:hypothetical protein